MEYSCLCGSIDMLENNKKDTAKSLKLYLVYAVFICVCITFFVALYVS